MEDAKLSITKTNLMKTTKKEPETTEILQTEQLNNTTFPKNANDLNKTELNFTSYMDNTKISSNQITLPNYFIYEYGLNQEDTQRYLELFLSLNLLIPMPFKQTVEKYTVSEIK